MTTAQVQAGDVIDQIVENRMLVERQRPSVIRGITERVRTGQGNLFVTVNFDEDGHPFEVFSTLGKAGSTDSAQLEAVSRLASLSLRSGAVSYTHLTLPTIYSV